MTALIIRPTTGRMEVHWLRAPRGDEPANKEMFRTATGLSIRPTWVRSAPDEPGHGHWTISREHLTDVARAIAVRDGRVEIEMHYNESERCDNRCQNATGNDCTCTCEGKYHGAGEHAAWRQVADTTLVKSDGIKIVTRVLTRAEALRS